MATPQFDSNTWYSLQSLGTKYYLACNSISICGAGLDALTNFEWFQINKPSNSTPIYIRPKARDVDENGRPFCINLSTGQPFLSLCTNTSATWGTGYWNGRDSGDGLYFYSTELSSAQRLSLNENGVWSLPDYNGLPASGLDQMRWTVSSLGAVNNQSYSTIPPVITLSATPIAAAMSTALLSTTTAPSSGVSSASSSSTTARQATSLSATSALSTTGSTSSTIVAGTPSITGTSTTARSASGPSVSSTTVPALQTSDAKKSGPSMRVLLTLSMLFAALQTSAWLM